MSATKKKLVKPAGIKMSFGEELLSPLDEGIMPKWMDCSWKRVPCGSPDCPICGRMAKEDEKIIKKGKNPESPEILFDGIASSLEEAIEMLKKEADKLGIDLSDLPEIKEPPTPDQFPLSDKVYNWMKKVSRLGKSAIKKESPWLLSEEAADLLWYSITLMTKTYRQLCNVWNMKNNANMFEKTDYEYTGRVLKEVVEILDKSLKSLSTADYKKFGALDREFLAFKKQVLSI